MEQQKSTYQAIARRYRPQHFSDMVGQEAIVATLKNAIRLNKVSHAYIFCGLRGTGKTTLARLFAKTLNCTQRGENIEPCNTCISCQEITSGRSLDVIEIDGASNRGIDDIRDLTDNIGYASTHGHYKIIIIDEVHMLTKEAFNALLKTLEEPPEKVKFFFATTEPHKVLPTILSRCQRFDLARISAPVIKKKLMSIASDLKIDYEEGCLDIIAERAEGSLRDAESLFDQLCCFLEGKLEASKVSEVLGLAQEAIFYRLDAAIEQTVLSEAFQITDEVFKQGKDPVLFLDQLLNHFRNLLALKLGKQSLIPSLLSEEFKASIEKYTEDQLLYILDYLTSSIASNTKTPFKRIHLEMVLLTLIRCRYRLSPTALTKRLIELESKLSIKPIKETVTTSPLEVAINKTPDNPPVPTPSVSKKASYHYDTLLRFTAVELEGTLKK